MKTFRHVVFWWGIVALVPFIIWAIWQLNIYAASIALWVAWMAHILTVALILAILGVSLHGVELLYHRHHLMASERLHARLQARLIANNDTAIYLHDDMSYYHVSAEHAQAMIPPPNVTVQEIKEIDREKIIELHQKHLSLRAIAKATGHSYYQVQKTCVEWDAACAAASKGHSTAIDPSDWREQA